MSTILKGVKLTLEIESIEIKENEGLHPSIQFGIDKVSDKLATLVKQVNDIQETINTKLL